MAAFEWFVCRCNGRHTSCSPPRSSSGRAAFALTADEEKAEEKRAKTVAEITEAAKPSLVVVSHEGRGSGGTGSGFVVSEDGLIATNLHVIGEARPVRVKFADGAEFEATEIHASDRKLDLAVVRIDPKDRKLTALPLADSDTLKQGQRVVALGNPQGLDFSVVDGVVSAVRDFGAGPMIQLAIPVERGNSGGPVLDFEGRVHGLMTLKSAVTENLGFAMPVNALKTLLEKPNPIAMGRWMTIGRLDPDEWTTPMGARWTQRAGEIQVREAGAGFGGRALCIASMKPPKVPYEVAVDVRLDDEAGAAGLVFESDGGDLHYGFYPTGGKIRMTRFDWPDGLHLEHIRHRGLARLPEGKLEPSPHPGRKRGHHRLGERGGNAQGRGRDASAADRSGFVNSGRPRPQFKNFRVGKDLTRLAVPEAFAKKVEVPLARYLADTKADTGAVPARSWWIC